MKKNFSIYKIYLVTVNDEPVYPSLDEDEARSQFSYERKYIEPGFNSKERSVCLREVNIKVDKQ